jgi:uncharacterized membrane protein
VKKLGKILLLLPALSMFILYIVVVTVCGGQTGNDNPLFIIGIILWAFVPVQWIFYITNVFRNTGITTKSQRLLWVWLLLGGHIFVFPFYWYFHIWKDNGKPQEEKAPAPIVAPTDRQPRFKSRSNRILILVISALPIIFFLITIISSFNGLPYSILYAFGVLYGIFLVGLIVFYIIDVFRNQSVPSNQKAIWAVALIIGNLGVFPFYWYIHIWKKS